MVEGQEISRELDEEATADYLLGSLALCGAAFEGGGEAARRALGWFRQLQGYGFENIPFLAVHDVGWLLLLGDSFPFRAVAELERWSEAERACRLAYENRFLNALRVDFRFRHLLPLVADREGPEPAQQAAADRLIRRALEILFAAARTDRLPSSPALNPVLLRDVELPASLAPESARQRFEAGRPGYFLAHLEEFLAHQAPKVDPARLLREEDLFELTHFEALDRPHRRLLARKVAELVSAAGPLDVQKTGVRVESQESATLVADEGSYPTGGLSEITTRGSIENLVRSELIYRDADPSVDLFALRWSEGDLLFYNRDSGTLHRKRRALVFLVEPTRLRVKDPRHGESLLVLACSLIARVGEDLLELFAGEGARVEIVLSAEEPGEAEREEAQLFGLRLREAMRRGDAVVRMERAVDPTALVDPRRRTWVVAIGDVPLDAVALSRAGGALVRVRLGGPAGAGELSLDPSGEDPAEEIGRLRDEILTRVVGVR